MATTGTTDRAEIRGDGAGDTGLARFHELVDSVNAILWEADAATRQFTYVSVHAETLLGYPSEQWLRERDFWKAHVHPGDRDWAVRLCSAAVEEGRDHYLEYRFLASNGRVRWLRDVVRVVREEDGGLRLRGVTVDVTDRHEAEERIRQLEAERASREAAEHAHGQLVELVGDLDAIVWEAEPEEWRFTFVSRGVHDILGMPAERWIADVECLTGAMHEADREGWQELRHACANGGPVNELTCRVRAADGRMVWLHTVVRTVRDEGGEVRRYRGVMVDVTAQMEAQAEHEALRRRLERQNLVINAALEQMPVGLLLMNPDGEIRARSDVAVRVTGDPLTPGTSVRDVRVRQLKPDGDEYAEDQMLLRRVLERREVATGEEMLIERPDGSRVPVRLNAAPVLDGDGSLIAAVLTAEDVSETRRLEAELRAREERLRLVMGFVPIQVWSALPDGRIDFVNSRMEEYFGRPRESLLGEGWRDEVHPDDRGRVLDQLSRSLANGEEFRAEVRLRKRNGAYRWHVSHALPQVDAEGRVVRWFGTNMDVDEARRAESALRERQQRDQLLGEAGRVLAGTLDSRAALDEVAALSLPLLGDFCSIDLVDAGGSIEQVGWHHVSPTAAAWHAQVQSNLPASSVDEHIAGLLVRSGEALLVADVAAGDERIAGRLRFLRPLQPTSLMAVPLHVQGEFAGALTFGISESTRRLTESDVALAAALADRASLAITAARLFDAARDTSERLRAALDASGTGTFRWEIATDRIDTDDEFARLIGQADVASSQPLDVMLERVHDDDRDRVLAAGRRSADEGADFDEEFRAVWPDGSVHWLVARGKVYRDGEGRPAYLTGACVDVTERRQREDRFRALAESIPQFVWIADADGSAFWYNQRWHDYTGLTFEELKGWGWRRAHHPEHVDRVTEGIRRSFETGQPWQDTFPLRGRAGEWRWFLGRAQPILDPAGAVELWFGTNTDITELREAELARDRALAEAQRANETKAAFLATLSHDLRTPLNAVNGYVSLILERLYGPVTPQQEQALGRVLRANDHLLALVEDILHFAKLESGNIELELEALDVAEVLAQVQPFVGPQLEAKGLRYEWREDEVGLRVRADRERLTQILVNLLTNAVKFTDEGGVRVEAEAGDDAVLIRVTDTGRGIREDQVAAIFEPFVQSGVRKGAREGFGLGLAISRQLARAMDGDLAVESEPGRGSTFTLTLPRA